MHRIARRWIVFATVAFCMTMVGCSSYRLEGLVIDGRRAGVYLVEPDDPRLSEIGIADATIQLTLDPVSLSPRPMGKTIAQTSGKFSIPIDAAGAGILEYDVGFYVRAEGFAPVEAGPMALPPSGKRLLIVMVPGIDKPRATEDLLDETRRESERWKVN